MLFIVSYETVDSSEECEREFADLTAARAYVDSLDGLLQWHSISDENGEIDPDNYIQFPCKIKFTVVPYVGVHRSLVHDCADQAQCDSYIDYLMSDTTGNTRNVMHSVYVAPKPVK